MPGPVLLLMDYQEGICREKGPIGQGGTGAEVAARGVLDNAARTLEAFRANDLPVVYVRVAFDEHYHRMTSASSRFSGMKRNWLMRESDPWSKICSEVEPRPDEVVLSKGCVNPFIGTHLEQTLIRLTPDELVMGGVATNHVVESAARHAADSGYRVVVLEDLCASFTAQIHEHSVQDDLPFYATVRTADDYLEELEAAQ